MNHGPLRKQVGFVSCLVLLAVLVGCSQSATTRGTSRDSIALVDILLKAKAT